MSLSLEKEALQYNLSSLIDLQNKRRNNIVLFEQSIKKERDMSNQEETIQFSLENKIMLHDKGINKLSDTEYHWILSDLPKLKTTREKRNQTIMLLKTAIIEEQTSMDREERMIAFLESNDGKK
jgi:hypothetical protein